MKTEVLGRHLIADLVGCNLESCCNGEDTYKALEQAAVAAGATPLKGDYHGFGEGFGVTGVIILAESHISWHTWPEKNGYVALDIFMCGKCDPRDAMPLIVNYFKPKSITITVSERGI
jgi:S-adenosylmethionine decarboxylase